MKRIALLILITCPLLIFGQDEDSVSTLPLQNSIDSPAYNNAPPGENTIAPLGSSKLGFMTSVEFQLSMAVLIFGLVIIGLEIFLIQKRNIDSDTLVKFIIVTLIVTGTLFLITAGYDNNQIAPAAGLFGTIAGYLLGKTNKNTQKNENE